jgi:glycosyltransferase involved in cell wall biosynthesis
LDTVLFVNHLRRGSASSFRQEGFAKFLRRRGYRTALLCRSRGDGLEGDGPFDRVRHWEEPFETAFARNLRVLGEELEASDLVHVNRANPFTASLLAVALTRRRRALVVDMEDMDGYGGYASYTGSYGPKGWALTAFEKLFPRRAGAVTVVSSLLREYMVRNGVRERRLFKVPNGFDPDLFRADIDGSPFRRSLGLGESPLLMYSSTYWGFEAGIHREALSSFRLVAEEVPGAKLVMTGNLSRELDDSLASLGLRDKVVRTGFVPRETMPEVMAAADAAIHVISSHPFHAASSPMIVPEYLAMGKPVVAPMVGELVEMLGGGAGVLVESGDHLGMARAAVSLLKDQELRRRVRASAIERSATYSYEAETKTLMEAYDAASA